MSFDAQAYVDRLCERHGLASVRVRRKRGGFAVYAPREREIHLGRRVRRLADDQLRAVIAHEFAHCRLRSWRYELPLLAMIVCWSLGSLALTALAALFAHSLLSAGICLLVWPLQMYTMLRLVGQAEEIACDWMGWRMTRDPGACADSFEAIGTRRRRWTPWASHPPLKLRIALARRAQVKADRCRYHSQGNLAKDTA
jgi:Zn-dependent protease with chaperone function